MDAVHDWFGFELTNTSTLVRWLIDPDAAPRFLGKLPKIYFNNVHMLARRRTRGFLEMSWGESRVRFQVDLRNRQYIDTARSYFVGGCYEPHLSFLIDRLLPSARSFYDVGANFGFHSVRAAANPAYTGTVHAFEISPRSFADLTHVVESSNLSRKICCHNFGISDVSGEVRFWEDQHLGRSKISTSMRAGRANARTIDELGFDPPDIIKLDVEGHEAAAMRGAAKTIERHNPDIIFENWFGSSADLEPLWFLSERDYRFFIPRLEDGAINLATLELEERPTLSRRLDILAVAGQRGQGRILALFSPERLDGARRP